jgi:phytoene synthase
MTNDPKAALRNPTLATACAAVVERAREHFKEARTIMARLPRRDVRAPRIMGLVYRSILDSLVARGWAPPRTPIRVSRARLLWIMLRHALV